MGPRRLAIPISLAIIIVGAALTGELACDQPVIPDPIDAGRLHKTSDANQLDATQPDASVPSDAGSRDAGTVAGDRL
jgi:hypothetical protein